MTNEARTAPGVPAGYHTVTPWIISRDTAPLLDFVTQAFGAEELGRVHGEEGRILHAEFRIGDSIVMAFDAGADWPDTPAVSVQARLAPSACGTGGEAVYPGPWN